MRRDVVALVATVVGFHAFCVLVDSNLFYNALAWIDPYTHVGLGLYYTDPNFWDNYYKISRVPWNALQFVVRHVFTPAASGVVIQSLCAVGTTLAVYRIGRTLFARDVALTVAMLATFFPFFHANGGADYNNALAAPLFFTTWALAQAWAERPRRAIEIGRAHV